MSFFTVVLFSLARSLCGISGVDDSPASDFQGAWAVDRPQSRGQERARLAHRAPPGKSPAAVKSVRARVEIPRRLPEAPAAPTPPLVAGYNGTHGIPRGLPGTGRAYRPAHPAVGGSGRPRAAPGRPPHRPAAAARGRRRRAGAGALRPRVAAAGRRLGARPDAAPIDDGRAAGGRRGGAHRRGAAAGRGQGAVAALFGLENGRPLLLDGKLADAARWASATSP